MLWQGTLEYLGEVPELMDARLAGWRVAKQQGAGAGEGEEVEVAAGDPTAVRVGDVVEYKLSERAKAQAADGREKGVGVLLSINRDRGDAATLPPELLDLCEVQILTLDPEARAEKEGEGGGEGKQKWMKDETESRVYVKYDDLKVVRATSNAAQDRWKRWVLEEDLSSGCGPPPYATEEMEIL